MKSLSQACSIPVSCSTPAPPFQGQKKLPSSLPSLWQYLLKVTDFRKSQGKRYELASILALGITATLCGYKSYGAMAQWGNNYGAELAKRLGMKNGKTPSVGTLFTVFSQIDKNSLEKQVSQWCLDTIKVLATEEEYKTISKKFIALSIDGKALRSSQRQGAVDAYLVSVVSHYLGLTIFQQSVADKTNEIPIVQKMLADFVVKGHVFTLDALHTQKETAKLIGLKGGTTS
jgi:DDE_Tnp_1-associated